MIKKLLSLSENLFTKTSFLTFAFRSKCRVNKTTSCKKNIAGRIPEPTRSTKTSQKAEAVTFCKPFTHYLPGSDLKIGEIKTTVTKRKKMQQNFIIENVW